ncbi:MAG: DNA repair protein RadC [Flavobacteriaceae bacterium]|jgi:DNA repair protein RadC|nr:DNA repair protein RadC [Flavobacteriaceae bacterium]
MSIKFLAEDDRPREKFLQKGENSLSDSELLAIIMGSGSREESAVELARRILNSVGNNWHNLSKLSVIDLMKFRGIGEAKAISISAALEIGRRRSAQEIPENPRILKPEDTFKMMSPLLSDLQTEEFWALFLNRNNVVIHKKQLAKGGISNSSVDVRILFKTALEHFATGIILVHNHPSGNPEPSKDDIALTQQIAESGKLMDIRILDHFIIAQNKFFSFAVEKLVLI